MLALSQMKFTSRLDSYIANISLPSYKDASSQLTLGGVIVYSVSKAPDGKPSLNRLWAIPYPAQTSVLCWSAGRGLCAVGMDDGMVHCVRVAKEGGVLKCEEVTSPLSSTTARVLQRPQGQGHGSRD